MNKAAQAQTAMRSPHATANAPITLSVFEVPHFKNGTNNNRARIPTGRKRDSLESLDAGVVDPKISASGIPGGGVPFATGQMSLGASSPNVVRYASMLAW